MVELQLNATQSERGGSATVLCDSRIWHRCSPMASLLTYGIAVFTYGIAAHLWHQLYMELEFPAEFAIGIGFARDGC